MIGSFGTCGSIGTFGMFTLNNSNKKFNYSKQMSKLDLKNILLYLIGGKYYPLQLSNVLTCDGCWLLV